MGGVNVFSCSPVTLAPVGRLPVGPFSRSCPPPRALILNPVLTLNEFPQTICNELDLVIEVSRESNNNLIDHLNRFIAAGLCGRAEDHPDHRRGAEDCGLQKQVLLKKRRV